MKNPSLLASVSSIFFVRVIWKERTGKCVTARQCLGYEGGDDAHAVGEDHGANERHENSEHALHIGARHDVAVPASDYFNRMSREGSTEKALECPEMLHTSRPSDQSGRDGWQFKGKCFMHPCCSEWRRQESPAARPCHSLGV